MRRPLWAGLVVVALLGAVVGGVVAATRDRDGDVIELSGDAGLSPPAPSNPRYTGDTLPAVALVGADGAAAALVGDGRPMVVNLWSSTCPPCARELVVLGDLDTEFGADVRFVGINVEDSVERMVEFARDRNANYEQYRDSGDLLDALSVVALPVTLFVAADGTIVDQTGEFSTDSLRRSIEDLLS